MRALPDKHRRPALDGLRGVAASVVVLHHVVLASVPSIASAYRPGGGGSEVPLGLRALGLLWAGPAFVIVFFVLSGFVLALPAASGSAFDARAYYPRRIVRLYAPVWGAFLLAATLHVLNTGVAGGRSWWLDGHAGAPTVADNAHALTLFGTGHHGLLTVLWSLQWEVAFSLLLPLLLLLAKSSRRWHAPLALAALGMVFAGQAGTGTEYLAYMPTFLLGTLMAFNEPLLDRVGAALAAVTTRARAARAGLVVTAVALLGYPQWLGGSHATGLLVTIGAVLLVLSALVLPAVREVLEWRPVQWLGSRSYSLYLVHEPIVVAVAFALAVPAFPVLLVAAVPAALLVAEAFFRIVERPSQVLAKRAGAAARRAARRPLVAASSPTPSR